MSLNVTAILARVTSHAQALGLFERVTGHEPKSQPGNGLTCAVWNDRGVAAGGQSGLSSTSALVVFNVRLYTSMLSDPQDEIDPNLVAACDALLNAYSGDFELGGQVRCVDLLGMAGTPLSWQAGYLNSDGKLYRVITVVLPLIISDVWEQVP